MTTVHSRAWYDIISYRLGIFDLLLGATRTIEMIGDTSWFTVVIKEFPLHAVDSIILIETSFILLPAVMRYCFQLSLFISLSTWRSLLSKHFYHRRTSGKCSSNKTIRSFPHRSSQIPSFWRPGSCIHGKPHVHFSGILSTECRSSEIVLDEKQLHGFS